MEGVGVAAATGGLRAKVSGGCAGPDPRQPRGHRARSVLSGVGGPGAWGDLAEGGAEG